MQGVHFVVVRELCGGIYFGDKVEVPAEAMLTGKSAARDVCTYSVQEIERITRVAGHLARSMAANDKQSSVPARVTSIDKANVLATSRLWKRVVTETMQREFPDVQLEHLLVDSAAMHMVPWEEEEC